MSLGILKHLLPTGRVWRITAEKKLREFFQGLTNALFDSRTFVDEVYQDTFPQTTRELDAWEQQFGLPAASLTDQQRRDRLAARWQALGGQSPRYIQDTLQNAGFDVYVHEWWEPGVLHPAGGAVDDDEPPVTRNPFDYLWDGAAERAYVGCGHDDAFCEGDDAFCESSNAPPGFPLVNKVNVSTSLTVGCGSIEASTGGDSLSSGFTIRSTSLKQYVMPADPATYPYYLYIGGETFPNQATVPAGRQDEFEALCLKICPTEQWLGMLITYA